MPDVKYRDNNQPRQLFLDSIVDFYGKLSNKEFWANDRKRIIALEAIAQDYIRTDHTGHKEDSITLQAAINEYHIRAKYMDKANV